MTVVWLSYFVDVDANVTLGKQGSGKELIAELV